MSLGSNAGQKAQINITPMIDILLVLIIIFMVITPIKSRGLHTLVPQPPQPDQSEPSPSHDIVITVLGDNIVHLNQEVVKLQDLRQRLAFLFKTTADHVLFIRAAGNLEFREVAEVIDIARGVGLNRVALMTS